MNTDESAIRNPQFRGVPVIAVTTGDPCGIGPEVLLKALKSFRLPHDSHLVVIGDLVVFDRAARRLNLTLPRWQVIPQSQVASLSAARLTFLDLQHRAHFVPGRSSIEAGRASLAYLNEAIALWKLGCLQALVSGPVTKWAIEQCQAGFVGQTEYLSRAMGRPQVVMMFVSKSLRVVLLTRHLPLREVATAINRKLLRNSLLLVGEALKRQFHIRHPRVAICGLNPHAGEEGLLGQEERRILRPVLSALGQTGIRYEGPFAADGFFANMLSSPQARGKTYDAVVCGYHDQGLIPFKMLARDTGAQLTLGLPIVRTSPDHGSALDIAGQGIAHPGSMRYALELTIQLMSTQQPKHIAHRKIGDR